MQEDARRSFFTRALRLLGEIPPGPLDPDQLADVCFELAPLDPERAAGLVPLIPESEVGARSWAAYAVACEMVRRDVPRALEIAAAIPSSDRRGQAYGQMAFNLAPADFTAARAILESNDPDWVLPGLLPHWPASELDALLDKLRRTIAEPTPLVAESLGDRALELLGSGETERGMALWKEAQRWLGVCDAAARTQAFQSWLLTARGADLWPLPRELLREVDGLSCYCNDCLTFFNKHDRSALVAMSERVQEPDHRALVWRWLASEAAARGERGEAWKWLHRVARIEASDSPPVAYWLEAALEVARAAPVWAREVESESRRLVAEDTEETLDTRVQLLAELGIALSARGESADGEALLDEALERAVGFEAADPPVYHLCRLARTLAAHSPERAARVLANLELRLRTQKGEAREEAFEFVLSDGDLWAAFPTWTESMFAHMRDPLRRISVLLQAAKA